MKNTMNGQQVRKQIVHKSVYRVYFKLETPISDLIQNQTTQVDPSGVRGQVWRIREIWARENVLEAVQNQAGEDYDV